MNDATLKFFPQTPKISANVAIAERIYRETWKFRINSENQFLPELVQNSNYKILTASALQIPNRRKRLTKISQRRIYNYRACAAWKEKKKESVIFFSSKEFDISSMGISGPTLISTFAAAERKVCPPAA